ncbi:translational GTPase TypA [Gammaproteobacteria bacterium AB-CW1]|uniref:Large ribosomal subunit assembly factor BipA n=1 Tax=Natronospira elongata TaxID=3110268 RepID=A0AAP6MM78_9GAMM|nr:translational GTPase TypA [Gammaproteobacteria bacterium AB-CW1]
MIERLRNVAIVAHVDHGKTTLVDRLLQQSGTLDRAETLPDRAMDSNDLERERGITILSKNTAIEWQDYRINIVDTPGHADFGGEVERVLSMVDAFVLLVDAVDGPMPQTRFVCQKAFEHGLKPIVVINKIDRPGARPDWVLDQTFDLLDHLGADEDQLDFPVVYASALNGWASMDGEESGDMEALFQTLVEQVPPPKVDPDAPLQLQVTSLDYSSYLGAIAVGRIRQGTLKTNSQVVVIDRDGKQRKERVVKVFGFLGLDRVEAESASAGDIVAFSGIDFPRVSDTVCDPEHPEAMTPLTVDEPTISMTFETNTSPFAGKEGKYVTSRQVRDRLMRETIHNVALKVEDTDDPERFKVSGRGELHLSILLENMRREGYELAVSRPEVIVREIDGVKQEPWELLTVDLDETTQGAVMEALGERGGQMDNMAPDGKGRVRLDYRIPARGLIGFQTDFRTLTSGTGIMHHVFDRYGPLSNANLGARRNGALISNGQGKAVGFALFNLQERGKLFVSPGDPVYEGQVIGIHTRDNDLTVNPQKAKQLTNVRASGKDDAIQLTPPIKLTLEQALEFINDDELIEVTPESLRVRKRWLKEHERKKAAREAS